MKNGTALALIFVAACLWIWPLWEWSHQRWVAGLLAVGIEIVAGGFVVFILARIGKR